ncbi:MAG: membrane protein insertion efficiency factor YidD [Candidatus Sumerlaeaceae bacterium]
MTLGEHIERPFKLLVSGLIRGYQRWVSPHFPPSCRFYPTCSNYALEALQCRRLLPALGLIVWRVLRCQPFCRGGYDPVPHAHQSGESE